VSEDAREVFEFTEPRYSSHRSRDAVMPGLAFAILKDGVEVGQASFRLTHAVGLDGVPDLAIDFRYTIHGERPEPELGFRPDMTIKEWVSEGRL